MLLNNNHIRGIFKYSPEVFFEKDDFVVDGNCIYICTSDVIGKKPSEDTEHLYYSEYPGNKIISASEYYDYVKSLERSEQAEDKYVSAHSLCEILENMYFGFGDNGLVYDHVIYNPNTGIEYSVRGVHEILDYTTPNVLDTILRDNDLNNGLITISRSLPEVRDLVMDSSASSGDVILKQYTYLDSENLEPYRVQELLDPEKNRLYFRFSKGLSTEDGGHDFTDAIVSSWKNLYSSNEDALEKLNALENYYQQRIQEEEDKIARMSGKYCYREVEPTEYNHLGEAVVILRPGETRDIKSRESFNTSPCLLNVLIKVQGDSGIFRNYSLVLDAKDACDSVTSSEIYNLGDGITLTSMFDGSALGGQTLSLSVTSGVIKNIYYRDYTLGHIHDWVLDNILTASTCTQPGEGVYVCTECHEEKTDSIPPLGHILTHKSQQNPTCIMSGWWEYWHCSRCGIYFKDSSATREYSGWDTGGDQVYRPALGAGGHQWGGWRITRQPTCTTAGRKTRSCTICGQQETETIPALGHEITQVREVSPTCGTYGIESHYYCDRCGKDFLDPEAHTEATAADLLLYPTGAHDLSAYNSHSIHAVSPIEVQESTYTDYPEVGRPKPEFGIGMEICATCGNSIQISLPLKMHTFQADQSIRHGGAFAVGTEHYPSYTQGYCIECQETRRNYDWREDIPIEKQMANHTVLTPIDNEQQDHRPEYTSATCTEYGYWTGTCILCGETNVRQYNWDDPPTGHQINGSNRESWIHNTCISDAEWVGKCSVCGRDHVEMVDQEHLEIGHVDNNHDGHCDVCNTSID